MSKNSSSGGGAAVFAIFVVIGLLAQIPKDVWIGLGVIVVGGLVIWAVVAAIKGYQEAEAERRERERAEQAAAVEAAKRERAERARREKQHRLATLGKDNAALVETALAAVLQVTKSEAARAGWLGDVDFTADIQGITTGFEKAHALRDVIGRLAALDRPSADDRKLLAEARTTAANLERAASERVELIGRCAEEARRVDVSLRMDREDARVAGERAELHATLSAMLYGIEATPDPAATDSTADAVIARVQAYREIKSRIQLVCDSTSTG
jgi:electron transfer flavoprotein alpha subunit